MSRAPKPSFARRVFSSLAGALDSVVEVYNPQEGFRRKQIRRGAEILFRRHQIRMQSGEFKEDDDRDGRGGWGWGGFESGERGRLDATWLYGSSHPDSALEASLLEMRAKSDSAYKNHELFKGHVLRRVRRVIGTGIMMAPQIRAVPGKITDDQAAEWNLVLRETFERWSHKAGGAQLPLYTIQRQVVHHIEKDGTAFVQFGDVEQNDPRIPINLRLKVIHPRRVETPPKYAMDPNVRHGIRTNPTTDRDVVGYYVRVTHPDDTKQFGLEYEFVPAVFPNGLPRMVQICELTEADQRIGYPHGQVCLRQCKNIEEYRGAEMERNIVAACTAAFVTGAVDDPADLAAAAAVGTDSRGRLIQEMSPAQVNYLPQGAEDIRFSNPPGPQATFEPFIDDAQRSAAAGIGTSKEMMTGDWRGLTYSGGKLIWVDEQYPIDSMQLDVIELLLIPLQQNFVNRCVTAGVIDVSLSSFRREPHIYERVKFVPQKRPTLDPRERTAALADIGAGITVHADEVEQMNGRPSEEVYDDIVKNIAGQLSRIGITLDMLRQNGGGTPLGGANPTAAAGGKGRQKREAASSGAGG